MWWYIFWFLLSVALIFIFLPYVQWRMAKGKSVTFHVTENGTESLVTEFSLFTKREKGDKIDLSVVIPSYNEELRITPMLESTTTFFEKKKVELAKRDKTFTYELIIVDDGSKDKTSQVVQDYSKNNPSVTIRVLICKENIGKGGAVRWGTAFARGDRILMADADNATEIEDFVAVDQLLDEIVTAGDGFACGSRNHLVGTVVKEVKTRKI